MSKNRRRLITSFAALGLTAAVVVPVTAEIVATPTAMQSTATAVDLEHPLTIAPWDW